MALFVDPLVILAGKDKTPWTVVSSDPASGFDGQIIINSTDNTAKVWYNYTWNTWFTLTPGVVSYLLLEDGFYMLTEDGFKLIL